MERESTKFLFRFYFINLNIFRGTFRSCSESFSAGVMTSVV